MQDAQAQGDNPAVLLAQYKISNLKHRIGQWPLPYWEPKDSTLCVFKRFQERF